MGQQLVQEHFYMLPGGVGDQTLNLLLQTEAPN